MRPRVLSLLAVATLVLAACSSSKSGPAPTTAGTGSTTTATPTSAVTPTSGASPAKIGHVFVIMLENKSYGQTWGATSPATYLNGTLRAQGQLLTNYYGIGHVSLDNYIAEISGQSPNPQTQADCVTYTDFATTGTGAYGQALGSGCVYPTSVKTIADQLKDAGKTWKSYQEDMASGPVAAKTCRHPAIGSVDTTVGARKGDMYATRHNPFVYFHSIIDAPTCQTDVVDLSHLTGDLASTDTTPNLSFITPNLCHDGHDSPCVDGQPGGLTSADQFLSRWVPSILGSPAYQLGGMLIVTFDEAEPIGAQADASACCHTPASPNSPRPGLTGPGGGRVGALVISTQTKPGTSDDVPYNHYSLLCSMEDLFGVPHLGFAGAPGLKCFGSDVLNGLASQV